MEWLGYVLCLVMGIVLGLIGGGGSILTVPILVYLFGLKPEMATGYSLLIVGVTSIAGIFSYFKRQEVDFKIGIQFLLPSLLGVYLARGFVLPRMPEIIFSTPTFILSKDLLIMIFFAALMIFASLKMIFNVESKPKEGGLLSLLFRGFLVGAATGFIGAGGGFLITPALHFMAGLAMRAAVGTSLVVIAVNSLFGFTISQVKSQTETPWTLLFIMSALSVLGILFGSKLASRVSELRLKRIFGVLVLFIGAYILLENLWFK